SFSPALKNAIDFVSREWWRKPVGMVSYGGVSGGTRGITAIEPVLAMVGLVRAGAALELPFVSSQISNGTFMPDEKNVAIMEKQLVELTTLAEVLKPLR
ncbi:MAG: hypothetical protein QOK46_148, partial [Microbacteriaceae bacterium]|nr:hypothetical protein [Microbacteriaceae bacterium]